jgi:hypothetical protein
MIGSSQREWYHYFPEITLLHKSRSYLYFKYPRFYILKKENLSSLVTVFIVFKDEVKVTVAPITVWSVEF